MAAADIDPRQVAAVGLSNIPQINLQSDSPDLSRTTSFQPTLGYDRRSREDSRTPTTDGLDAIESGKLDDRHARTRPGQFVARDGAIGGKHNDTNVE
jgi:hypothetical protein